MTCKTRCNPDEGELSNIIKRRLISDADGSQWELILNYKTGAGHITPLFIANIGDKLISVQGRPYTFKLPDITD